MRGTLEHFVDFDRLNDNKTTRISVGAVEIASGQLVYFDSYKEKIRPEHIMASAALPPGFPAIEIEGKFYWDGGLSSNTPISYVMDHDEQNHMLCFMINLFDSYGLAPECMDDIHKRKKDIEFSSKACRSIELYKQLQELKNCIHHLSHYIPNELKSRTQIKSCLAKGRETTLSLVHFLCEHEESDLSSKDFEFLRKPYTNVLVKGIMMVNKE